MFSKVIVKYSALLLMIFVYIHLVSYNKEVWIFVHKFSNVISHKDKSQVLIPLSSNISSLRILLWTPTVTQFYEDEWKHVFARLLSKQCPENRCELVWNNSLIHSADAVVFYTFSVFRNNDFYLPEYRRQDQPWIFFGWEAHYNTLFERRKLEKLFKIDFNWTMHYRLDSDIVVPYGSVTHKSPADTKQLQDIKTDYWSKKNLNKTIAWMVSHCDTSPNGWSVIGSMRETFVVELQKYISVHVYGKCGPYKCGKSNTLTQEKNWNLEECAMVTNQYMFYLAFENSICPDYATEKFFRALTLDVIPVVMGGADYDSIAPPNSFIDALQFSGPEQLAHYLTSLAENQELYNKYFEWKAYYDITLGHPYSTLICDLCSKLHQFKSETPDKRINLNIEEWIRNGTCEGSWKKVLDQRFPDQAVGNQH